MLGILMVATLLGTALPAALSAPFPVCLGGAGVLLATRLYGLRWGLTAALLAGAIILSAWLPVTVAALLLIETLVVGMLFRRGVANIFIADFVFWAAFGLPLLWLLHGILLHSDVDTALTTMAWSGGNGLLNALLAALVFHLIPDRRKKGTPHPSLWESQLNLVLACFLLPTLVLAGIHLYGPRDFVRSGLVAEMAAVSGALTEGL